MGGYGAVKLALKCPQFFCSAVSHSAALDVRRRIEGREGSGGRRRLFGPSPGQGRDDLYALAEKIDRTLRPALRIDCGLEDGLLEENRAFHRHLEQLGIPHEYAECPGAHTWEYWDCHIQEALAFHQRALGLGDGRRAGVRGCPRHLGGAHGCVDIPLRARYSSVSHVNTG